DVEEVPLRRGRATAGSGSDADIVRRLFAVRVESEQIGRGAQRRRGGAEGDVVALDLSLAHFGEGADADAPVFERAVRQRRLDAAGAEHVRIAVAVEVEEVDVGRARAVGCAGAEDQERDLAGSIDGAGSLDDAARAAKAGAVREHERARAEPGRAHETSGD